MPASGRLSGGLGGMSLPGEGGSAHTMRLDAVAPPPEFAASATKIERMPVDPAPAAPHRARSRRRAIPLVGWLAVGVFAFVTSIVVRHATQQSLPVIPSPYGTGADTRVTIPPGEAQIGLSEDNKEAVLAVCFSLSERPNTECRRAHLESIGEWPAQTIALPAYAIDAFEVSNTDWQACEEAGACATRDWDDCDFYTVARGREIRTDVPSVMRAGERPAVCMTYDEAGAYCAWNRGRLPTEHEWERASRSGDDRLQPWGRFVMPGLLNWGERILVHYPIPGRVDGHELTAPVDSYRSGATDEGVHNMLGNVAEWVVPAGDVTLEPDQAGIRGSSYADGFQNLRLTHRAWVPRQVRRSTIGLRCVYEETR